jgi:MFS family permease
VLFEIQLLLGIVSFALSLTLVGLFFKLYWTQRQIFLLGLPFGFLLLSISYGFLLVHFIYPYAGGLSYSLMWLRVIMQTGGFALIAASYILHRRSQRKTSLNLQTIALLLILVAIITFGLLDVFNPPGLSIIYSLNDLFSIANLALLSYIILLLVRNYGISPDKNRGLITVPVAFAAFWSGQISFLLWEYTRSDAALIFSQVGRVIGLALLIQMYYLAGKEVSEDDGEQT